MIGTKIGPYDVLEKIGEGGMGVVYRARDPKLDRPIALKVLPQAFASDAERLARFEREARTLASLNHPHIAQIFGFVDGGGSTPALAMELVEGDDLSRRIARGPIPLDEALGIARQIAAALEAAHEQGTIHRDLKPANIKVRDDGVVKVLDFGLAKAMDPGGVEHQVELSKSPTITTPAMTQRGVILGTAAYMSPEQAKGRVVDKRADIWAFGCVLYEMITARRAFDGDDVSETFASVLKGDVDWTGVPTRVRRLLRRCLERDPKRRLHDIADVWDLIDETPEAPASPARSRAAWPAWAAASVLLATTLGLAAVYFGQTPPIQAPIRFQVSPPDGHAFDIYLALSPDGRRLAFTARDEGNTTSLWVRDLDSLESRRLPGTDGAWSPFWSPDGRYLGFAVQRVLKRVDVTGGSPETLIEAESNIGMGAWNQAGAIVFGSRGPGALRLAGSGAPAVTDVDLARGETFHSFPTFLPDGRQFLYFRQSSKPELQGIYVGRLDVPSTQQSTTRIAQTNLGPVYATFDAQQGRLWYIVNGALVTQPFDLRRMATTGEPVRVAERIGSSGSFAAFAVSKTGVLAYRTGAASATVEQLMWLDRRGQPIGNVGEPRPYAPIVNSLTLSPDGARAVVAMSPMNPDLWVVEFSRGIITRLTFRDTTESHPVWSPDGSRIAYRVAESAGADLFVRDTLGTTDEAVLLKSPGQETPTDWSRDGRFLLYQVSPLASASDIWVLPQEGDRAPVPLLQSEFNETGGRFSPDGRLIAYVSNESGRSEVYLRPFSVTNGKPAVGPKWQVSSDGGQFVRWRRDGRELFFRLLSGAVMAVDVDTSGGPLTAMPRKLFDLDMTTLNWDVAADGQRFLVSRPTAAVAPDPITVVVNWQATLER
jgi:Tol biopolymer transport system component